MKETLCIVDYGSGNLRSVANACDFVTNQSQLPLDICVTSDPQKVQSADRVILPGVGAFGDCRQGLMACPGMLEALQDVVLQQKKPFLGICVGMQLLADVGHEHGDHKGLGWIPGEVHKLQENQGIKIPHMGWNTLTLTEKGQSHPIFAGLDATAQVYFVHSYAFTPRHEDHILATTDYAQTITAAIGHGNLVATQFHPEKSQDVGLRIMKNFLTWTPDK